MAITIHYKRTSVSFDQKPKRKSSLITTVGIPRQARRGLVPIICGKEIKGAILSTRYGFSFYCSLFTESPHSIILSLHSSPVPIHPNNFLLSHQQELEQHANQQCTIVTVETATEWEN